MNLYIEIENGAPKNHPALEENLLKVFGEIPTNWEPFVRVESPVPALYQKLSSADSEYVKVDGVWTDVWTLREMTTEEKTAVQDAYKYEWSTRPYLENFAAWIFDETTCTYKPPISRPAPDQTKLDAGIFTVWCGAENNWKDTPVKPADENPYKFDFFAWQWVAV